MDLFCSGPIMSDRVSLQTILKKNPSNSFYIFLLDMNFENRNRYNTCFFMFLTHISNSVQIRYVINYSINTLFLCINLDHKNLKFKNLIDDITINFWSSWNFVSMEDIIKTYNLTVRFSKFASIKKIEEEFEGYGERNFFQRGFITWVFCHLFSWLWMGTLLIWSSGPQVEPTRAW